MEIAKDCVVSMDYRLTGGDGKVLDESAEGQPLVYLHGHGNIIPGLESALDGRSSGESLNVRVAPADAYGELDPRLVQEVERSMFPAGAPLEVGMRFHAGTPQGPRVVRITAIGDKTVKVDANHELAGETLDFAVTIRDVRAATADEIAHGHVHAGGSCGHGH
ncbi:MAG: peptidylprolyl isomerase [Opitutales bacterium]|nr:peptidylprolyl isomerase [Opitutales bacterium]